MKPDYGIDAPGIRRGMLAAGLGGLLVAVGFGAAGARASGPLSAGAVALEVIGALAALYGLGMAAFMTFASRIGKLRTRDRLLDLAATLRPFTGGETVLDVGCGRGLMTIGAARRLTTGTAIGIDLWRTEDQSGNTPAAALENARREGVSQRVRIETGDARSLPFPDTAFDLVLSHWMVHNLPEAADRHRALDEMMRVLRPGGVLVLADIANHAEYCERLIQLGLTDVHVDTGGAGSWIMGILSGGSFRPQAVVGVCC